jgi:predicted dehydrogenase
VVDGWTITGAIMVRTLVLGAGPAGRRLAQALRATGDGGALVGVFDADAQAAQELADRLGVPVLDALEPALEGAEAAVIGGPAERRVHLTRMALQRGLDVLVEPPLGQTVDDAHGLLSAIVRAPRRPVAMVAFDDHFDPTIAELRRLVAGQTIVGVHSERCDPAPAGGPTPELDVVQALMQRDLAIVLAVTGEPIAATQAAGRRLRNGGPIDHAHALLVLDDDRIVSLLASRAGGARVRRIEVTTTMAKITADLDARVVEVVRTSEALDGRCESIAQRVVAAAADPAVLQAQAFLRHIERRSPPDIGIGIAIAAQEAAQAILKRIELVAHRPAIRRGAQAA